MIVGIIAEYNPMHNGHIYQINYAKNVLKADKVIVIMSGSFTQNGNISLIDKFSKANIIISNNADLVIELPTIYATSSSENFTKGAIKLLDSLNVVDCILFGAECNNINTLKNISRKLIDNENIIKEKISNEEKSLTYAKARANVLKEYLTKDEFNEINKPNNILGLSYISNLIKLNSNIHPICITRVDGISSTIIRESLRLNDFSYLKENTPEEVYNYLINVNNNIYTNNNYLDKMYQLIRYNVIFKSTSSLSNIYEVAEGLENKVKLEIINNLNYNDFLTSIKSKRYTLARIKRLLINILLNITKDFYDNHTLNTEVYAHILKASDSGKLLISNISKNSTIPIIHSYKESCLNKLNLNNNILELINLDVLSSNIHSILFNKSLNTDFTNKL